MAEHEEIDVVEELGIQPVRRPLNIENDVSSLGQKKKVSHILQSPYFKEELENAVTDVLFSRHGGGGHNIIANEVANVFSPQRSGHAGIGCVSPINDLTGVAIYTKNEKLLRCKLATLYRIVDLFGWTHTIFNHITVRIDKEQEHFLINPFGLLYHEVSASKLLKVNMQGEVLDSGSTTLGMNAAGYTLHSAIHASRPDIHCVIHVHTPQVVAVSCMECGLLPISQESLIVGEVSYHPYHGILVDQKERKAIQKHLGPTNKVMILQNHGLVACGETVEEAFLYLYNAMIACDTQVKAMSCVGRHDKLIKLDRTALKSRTEDVAREDISQGADHGLKWGVGEMMFEALVRMLDDMGYRSGYCYRNPNVVKPKPKAKANDVQEPPTVASPISSEDLEDMKGSLRRTDGNARWVNSPNMYTRVLDNPDHESSATSSQNGDVSPKTRTKWKRSVSPGGAQVTSSIRTNPNQFVPTNTDPREVAVTRKSIRGQSRKDHKPAGPQSQLLAAVATPYQNGVSTSSKAIIERGEVDIHVVAAQGPPNPFNQMSDLEIDEYRQRQAATTWSENGGNPEADHNTQSNHEQSSHHDHEASSFTASNNGNSNLNNSKSDLVTADQPIITRDVAALEITSEINDQHPSSSSRNSTEMKGSGDETSNSSSSRPNGHHGDSPSVKQRGDEKAKDGGEKKKKKLSFLKKKKQKP